MKNVILLCLLAVSAMAAHKGIEHHFNINTLKDTAKEMSLFNKLKLQCERYGTNKSYLNLLVGAISFGVCVQEEWELFSNKTKDDDDDLKDIITFTCRFTSELNECYTKNLYYKVEECVSPDLRDSLPAAPISKAAVEFFCTDDGAQDRLLDFITEGESCLNSRVEGLLNCANVTLTKLVEEDEIFLTKTKDKACRSVFDFHKCLRSELLTCPSPAGVSYVDSFFDKMKNASPCSDYETSEPATKLN